MSFTDEYLALRNKKKKKTDKETSTGHSFTDEYNAKRAVSQEKDDDIAPVPARKYVYVNKTAALSRAGSKNDIAPITKATAKTTTEKEEKKGRFEGITQPLDDGWDAGDITSIALEAWDRIWRGHPENRGKVTDADGDGLRDASWWDATVKSAKRGYYNSLYGEETFSAMLGQENNAEVYRKILEGDEYQFETDGVVKKAVSGAAELLGQMGRQFTNKDTMAAAMGGAGTFAAGAAALGQAGPQIAAPEELVTVPAAAVIGFKTGMTAGSAKANLEIEAGHAYNEMIENGVSEETARNIALVVGGVNAGLELVQADELFKAFKVLNKTGVSDTAVKRISKELLARGVDVAKETAQEVAQEGVTIAGVQAASKKDTGEWAYTKEEVGSRLGETAMSSALSFGAMNVPAGVSNVGQIVSDNANTNKLTANEQKVVEHEYEKRIADQDLTTKQKNDIRNEVIRDMERGRISTDTIEEVLGGEDYTRYQDTIKQEDGLAEQEKALKEEFDALNQMKQSDMTGEQIDRRLELKEQLEELRTTIESTKNHSAKDVLKQRLGENVMSLVQNDRLAESYNERSRRGQAYQADLSKYDAKQQATIQKAIDSGILNNTNRTHEFVDLIAKITADKGVLFDFTNNAKLKESGFALDGKTVNGYVTKDGVTLNIDSAKSLNSVVGHEITHVLEGAEMYTALQSVVTEYAKATGEYQSRYDALAKLYEGVEGADINAELTADLVGDYLFTDTDFVKHLSVTNRNVFQKIYDEIKYLYKVATAGSKEARDLEKVKRVFAEVYRADGEAQKNTAASGVKYSLTGRTTPTYEELTAKKPIRIVDVKVGIESGSYADMKAAVTKVATDEGWFDRPHHNNDTDSLIFLTEKSFSHAYSNLTADFGEDTIRCMAHIPEIIQNAALVHVDNPKDIRKAESKVYTFFGAIDGVNGVEPVKLTVKEFDFSSLEEVPQNIRSYFEKNGATEKYNSLYDAHALEVIGIEGVKKEPDASGKVGGNNPRARATSDSTISIKELLNLVKGDAEKYIPKKQLSLSSMGEQPAPVNGRGTFGKDIALETAPVEEVAPVQETVAESATVEENLFPDDLAPIADDPERFDSLDDADAPPEMEAPYAEEEDIYVDDPFDNRDYADVGKRNVKAYMYENPEVKPFFQAEAEGMLGDLMQSIKGERLYNDEVYYATGGVKGWGGTKRHTTDDIAYLLDSGYTYAQIEKGLNAIIEDNGAENNAVSKRIEFALNDRLLNGFRDLEGRPIPPNEEYINLIYEKQINEYSKEAFDRFMENADAYAPPAADDIAPVAKPAKSVPMEAPVAEKYEAIAPKKQTQPRMAKATPAEKASAQVLTEEPKVNRKKPTAWNLFKDNFIDKGTVFETLSLKTGNRELQAKWKSIGRAESSAQWFMEHGNAEASSLKSIRETVEKSGKTQQFSEYLYHMHNVDRMSLVERKMDTVDKPVFGYGVTSEMSKAEAAKLEKANPEFKEWANSVYSYMTTMREMMVDNGVISSETAKLWAEMYPHYVPIRRKGDEGLNINVALDTKRTGVNAPIKKATGGNRNILPLFDTMALRTEQTFKAIARNRFGVELKNLLGTTIEQDAVSVDDAIDSVEGELLQEGKDGRNPTFTVFENGEKVTFEITDEMYNTMKPKSDAMMYTNKVLNTANNIRRGLLTEYNPAFMLTNPIKDTQDVLINSQHPARTYANYPKAMAELWGKKGQYYQEYMEHGGEMNTYFDGETKTFANEKSGFAKVIGFPLEKISQANNFIERVPRMAEYIASRKMGRSIDVSMLDAARVTTDFSAGGDLVKMANRNGFTFLNASVQGAAQQVRNVREAKHEGAKGWAKLAAKVAAAGLPAMLLNHLLWDDDEDYEELSDYVKQNYYVVAKYGDGKFVRIPKGRALAVIQNGFEQMENLITGNDEVDFDAFAELVVSNLAPNNPLENNLIAPIMQAKKNTTWYGDDLVPTRLQDLPAANQYDETTDSLSKWLGEKLNISPYKINYVLDQYSGALGDTFLPMMTPEAERGNENWWGNLIAPISDKFTTDSVLKNQNVSDFYDKKDELAVKANADGATDEDVLMSKYMNSVNADLAKLYAAKRQIQNSDMPNAEKYEAVRDVQKQIVDLTKDALGSYDDISFESDYREGGEYARMQGKLYKLTESGEWSKLSAEQATKYEVTKAAGNASYATDGTNHYRWYVPGEDASGDAEPGWRKVTDKELERQKEVTSGLGISPETYWNNREEYSYAYDNPESYAVAKAVGGYDAYKSYSSELYDIKADKDEYGKSISGSRKEKVQAYINDLDADYYTKIILWKSEYTSDDTYNTEIIDYLNGRDDISFEETIAILRKLGFDVTDDGDISW